MSDASLVIRCDCRSPEHMIVLEALHWDTDKPPHSELYVYVQLDPGARLLKRAWLALQYAVRGRAKKWLWTDTVLRDADVAPIRDFLNTYLTTASAMSAGTAETQSGSGRQPASAVPNGETPK